MIQWNFIENLKVYIKKNALQDVVCEMMPFCVGLNVLIDDTESSHVFWWTTL